MNPDPHDVLAAFRTERGPSPRAAAANFHKLMRRIESGEPAPVLSEPTAEPPPDHRTRNWALALAAAAALLLAARFVWPERFAARGHDPAVAAPYHHSEDDERHEIHPREPAAPRREANARSVPEDSALIPPPPPRAPVTHKPVLSSMSERPANDADLARELVGVRAAAEAVRAGDGAAALRHTDDYLRQHPRGAFVPEARLRRIEALCLLARAAEARREVTTFLSDYPTSPLRERVQGACILSHGSAEPRPLPE